MFPGVLALLERSLRVDARALAPHLARFGLMVLMYFVIVLIVRTNHIIAAPGLRFLLNITYLNLTFMTLLGIEFFSSVITEEKEDDTLGLMLMAGISPLGILLGKAGGRLVQALLLIAVQYPFILLATTMGGASHIQIQSTYIAMLAFMVMLSGVGLLCSTLAPRNRSASRYLLGWLVAYCLIPVACNWYLTRNATSVPALVANVLEWIAESCVFFQVATIVTNVFGETMWTRQVISNLTIGAIGFFLSWALFDLAARHPSIEAVPRGMVTRTVGSRRWFSPGRPWHNQIAWKDFHFIAGGKPAVLIRFLLYSSALLATMVYSYGFLAGMGTAKTITVTYLNLTLIALAIDAGMLISRSLQTEVRAQTFGALVFLPVSTGKLLYSKFFGSLLNWVPGVICLLAGILILPHGQTCFVDFFKFGSRGLWFFYVIHLVLIPHAAAVYAIFVRTGALPLAICTAIGFLVLLFFISSVMDAMYRIRFTEIFGYAILGICIWCHSIVWREISILAAK